MATDFTLKIIMLLIGYFGVSRLFPHRIQVWGFFVAIVIVALLTMLQSVIAPWPLGIPTFLLAYVAFGVGLRSMRKPHNSGDAGGSDDSSNNGSGS